MRSSKSKKVLKSFKELKAILDKVPVSPPRAAATVREPVLTEPPAQSDRRLFQAAMADVVPMARRKRSQKIANPSPPKVRQDNPDRETLVQLNNLIRRGEGFVISDTPEYIEGTGHRVPGLMARRLHRGSFSIQASIDLHGLSVAEAKEAFETFMSAAVSQGKRTVLVIHGRGLSSPAGPVLKSHVYNWLSRGHWRKRLIAFASARSCDGGAGATYVLLRQHQNHRRTHCRQEVKK